MFMAVDLHSFKLLYVEFYVFKTKDWLSKHLVFVVYCLIPFIVARLFCAIKYTPG